MALYYDLHDDSNTQWKHNRLSYDVGLTFIQVRLCGPVKIIFCSAFSHSYRLTDSLLSGITQQAFTCSK